VQEAVDVSPTTELIQGRYRRGRLLGRGGMADVYLAYDEIDGGEVAIKTLRSADPKLSRRLMQEARALQRLDHPGLVRLLGSEIAGGEAHLVMELVDAPTLAERLLDGPLDSRATADLGAQIAEALAYVHASEIVHRDVKPANILVPRDFETAGGAVRLADFGIARLVDASTITIEQTTLGTAAYMAPEQLEDHHVGPVADVWSLGVVLLECLTGRRVYEGTPGEIIARRLAGPVPVTGDLPVPWRIVLTGMLDHRPEQRLSAAQVASFLRAPALGEASFADIQPPAGPATAPLDLRALAGTTPPDAATVALPEAAVAVAATVPDAPTDPMAGVVPPLGRRGITPAMLAALLAVAIVLVVAVIALSRGGNGPGVTTTTVRRTTTTVHTTSTVARPTTTTLPTTTLPSTTAALSTLLAAVTQAANAGMIDQPDAQQISSAAENALQAPGATQATQALQQAATAISAGMAAGRISTSVGGALQTDLVRLATALGLPGAATATTTTTTTAPPPPTTPPGPPGKHHHGNGG
jgi:hypothetical protein